MDTADVTGITYGDGRARRYGKADMEAVKRKGEKIDEIRERRKNENIEAKRHFIEGAAVGVLGGPKMAVAAGVISVVADEATDVMYGEDDYYR